MRGKGTLLSGIRKTLEAELEAHASGVSRMSLQTAEKFGGFYEVDKLAHSDKQGNTPVLRSIDSPLDEREISCGRHRLDSVVMQRASRELLLHFRARFLRAFLHAQL